MDGRQEKAGADEEKGAGKVLNDKRSYLQYGGLAVLLFLLFGMQDLLFKAVDYHGAVSCVDVDLQMSPMAAFWILIWLLPKLLLFSVCFYQFVRIYESKSCYFFIRNTKKNVLYLIITKRVLLMMLGYILIRIIGLGVLGVFPQTAGDLAYILMEAMWIMVLYLSAVCLWSWSRAQWISMAVIAAVIIACFAVQLGWDEGLFADMLLIDSPDPILVFAVITIILFVLSKDMTLRFYDRAGGV